MSARTAVWSIGLVVAIGAGVATAHGLFVVAVGAGVPAAIAWLYPLITDGLALVAYAATTQLRSQGSRGYAWIVVVVAAGLSGLAQATYLAGAVTSAQAHTGGTSVPGLRAGVGAWPAIAAAIVAHLLFLIRSEPRHRGDCTDHVGESVTRPSTQPSGRSAVQTSVQKSVQGAAAERSTGSSGVQRAVQAGKPPAVQERPSVERRPASNAGAGPRERARDAARRYASQHGRLPTVDQLTAFTGVSRGTAGNALKDLRDQPPPLHVVHDTPEASADQ